VQTCSKCNASSPDTVTLCSSCGADLREYSLLVQSLKNLLENPRVKSIRVSVSHDACPFCYALMNTYTKDEVPLLPHTGCSHELGCRCFYEPVLAETAIVGKVIN